MVRWTGGVVALLLAVGCKGQEQGGQVRPVAEAPAQAAPAATTATPAAAPKQEEPSPREAPIYGEAKTLIEAYKENEVRADAAFKGKLVQVHGVIGDVKKDITDSIYVTIGTGAMLEIQTVQCFIAAGQEKAVMSLSKGQRATVRGRVEGLMMNVLMKDCVVNPVLQLCKGLQSAIGATECRLDKEKGDANGLVLPKTVGANAGAAFFCAGGGDEKPSLQRYDEAVATMQKNEGVTVVGSRRALCLAAFFNKDAKGKPIPVPAEITTKAQAFFDKL